MTRQSGPLYNEEYLRQGMHGDHTFVESIPRWAAQSNLAALTSGEMQAVAVPLNPGDTAEVITFVTGATHAVDVTAGFVALYSNDPVPVLLDQSPDWGAATFDANTPYSFAIPNPHTVVTGGIYYVAVSFTAGTVPTLRGTTVQNAVMAGDIGLGEAVLAMNAGTAVGGTAPATLEMHTVSASIPYVVVS
jgi:hypothetical protein